MLIPIMRSGQGPKSCQNENPATNSHGENAFGVMIIWPAASKSSPVSVQPIRAVLRAYGARAQGGLGSHPHGVMTAYPFRGLPVIMRSWRRRTPRRLPEIPRFSHRPDSADGWSMRYEHLSADRRLRIPVGLREQLPGGAGRFGRVAVPAPAGLAERVRRAAGPHRRDVPVRPGQHPWCPHHRRYVPGTMVLETTWHTPTGWLVVNDLLVVRPGRATRGAEPTTGGSRGSAPAVGHDAAHGHLHRGQGRDRRQLPPDVRVRVRAGHVELRRRGYHAMTVQPARGRAGARGALQPAARRGRGPVPTAGPPSTRASRASSPSVGGPAPDQPERGRRRPRRHGQLLAGLAAAPGRSPTTRGGPTSSAAR